MEQQTKHTPEKCNECGETLNPKKIKWLELSQTDGHYYESIPSMHISQGAFAFGASCARKKLAETTVYRQERDSLKIELYTLQSNHISLLEHASTLADECDKLKEEVEELNRVVKERGGVIDKHCELIREYERINSELEESKRRQIQAVVDRHNEDLKALRDINKSLVEALENAGNDLKGLSELAMKGKPGEFTIGMFKRISYMEELISKAKALNL